MPAKDADAVFRLPIDRVFSMKGFGTVVTGTLISGSVSKDEELEVHPTGKRLRVRGVQVHGCGGGESDCGTTHGAEPCWSGDIGAGARHDADAGRICFVRRDG